MGKVGHVRTPKVQRVITNELCQNGNILPFDSVYLVVYYYQLSYFNSTKNNTYYVINLSIHIHHWCADTKVYPHKYVRTYFAYSRPLL